jgi:hypothetical protein
MDKHVVAMARGDVLPLHNRLLIAQDEIPDPVPGDEHCWIAPPNARSRRSSASQEDRGHHADTYNERCLLEDR